MTELLTTTTAAELTMQGFLLDIGAALVIGLFLALTYSFRTRCTKSFLGTLILLPAVVAMVIMMVNGSIGAGIAVAGAFSLVRFRSVPGSAREIAALFLAMSAGLACGMGQLVYGGVFVVIMGLVMMLYALMRFGDGSPCARRLVVMIPEDLDYTGVFDDLMETYTSRAQLVKVKTTNMGSMMKLTYELELKNADKEREFLNEMRCRNGNLEISISQHVEGNNEL